LLLVTFSSAGGDRRIGALRDDQVRDLSAHVADFMQLFGRTFAELAALDGPALPRDAVRLHAPFRPGKIIGVGLNYVEHVEESSRSLDTAKELPDRPVLFSKPPTAVVGPEEPIQHNGNLTQQLDWECELAVIIGRTATRVSPENALNHVFGYSIMNDISARDQRRGGQWWFSKGQDSYAPFGPAVRTAEEIPDPQTLALGLRVNGEVKQKGNTRHMLFTVATLIADISAGVTLEPGDVISTGSPQGVGAAQNPPQFLQPGDVVECTVERIGTLRNPVVDAR
jgi:2-keto-4-pentenoate hydratase/2-oxohepta-3-ene-1,7-dioic acid hydratase in catechol pathway